MINKFKPDIFLKNNHIQTIYASFFRKFPKHNFFIEKFIFNDDDFTHCYWYKEPSATNNKPIVVLFHGLAGSYKSHYIQGVMQELDTKGFDCVVLHFRSCSGVMNKKVQTYHSGKTDDALEYMRALRVKFPNKLFFGVGFSLGANMLLKLLGEEKENSLLTSAIAVSAPMMLDVCANSINKGFSKFYESMLVKNLNILLEQKYEMHDMQKIIGLKKEDVKNIKTFWEFDEIYTAKVNGFKSAQDYYEKSSARQFLKDIQTPTLIIHAKDDPFMSPEIIPAKEEVSLHVELEIYENGGHVGFVNGSLFKPEYWLEKRVSEYFEIFLSLKI